MGERSLSLCISNECILKLITENFADPSGIHLHLHLLPRVQQWAPPLHWSPNVVSVSAGEGKHVYLLYK